MAKEIYSFPVSREIVEEESYINKKGEEATKKKKVQRVHRVIFTKPSFTDIEKAEFFYGQQYNKFINAGFLTKAMVSKKFGDIGGISSKTEEDGIRKALVSSVEASRVVEFFGSGENLSEEEREQLNEAKETLAESRLIMSEYEQNIRSQYSQTAEAKAEEKIMEWFLFYFSFYEDESNGKKELFPLFDGESFDEKRARYVSFQEEDYEAEDKNLHLKLKSIFDKSFNKLISVIAIWYNKIATDQESVDKALKEMEEMERG